IKIDSENEKVVIEGVALFSRKKMTGTIKDKKAMMLLLLTNKITKELDFNIKYDDKFEDEQKNYVDLSIRHIKRKLKVNTDGDNVNAKVDLKLRVEIEELASDHLDSEQKAQKLEKR